MAMPTWQHLQLTAMSKLIVDLGSITSFVVNLLVLGQFWPVIAFLCVIVSFGYFWCHFYPCNAMLAWVLAVVVCLSVHPSITPVLLYQNG